MTAEDFAQSLAKAANWWIVRGEGGRLWTTLFKPNGVVAHGSNVERFRIDLPFAERDRALLGLDSYGREEVHEFHDKVDIGDAIVTPDAGGRTAWLGVVASEPIAGSDTHWIQRQCCWHPNCITLTSQAASAMPKKPLGTIFNVTRHKAHFLESFLSAS